MRTFTRVVFFALTYVGVFVAAAEADIRYSYVGDTFAFVQGVYTQTDRITGNFVLSDSFVPNGFPGPQNITSGVVSYSFTDGHQTLTQGNSTGEFHAGFLFSEPVVPGSVEDLNGWWSFELLTPTSGIDAKFLNREHEMTAWIGADRADQAQISSEPPVAAGGRGTWTIERVAMPEAGGTALFLFTNLAGLTILALFIGLKRVRRGL